MNAFLDRALYYAKSIAGLVSAVAVALLTIYGPETQVGHWLTVAVAVAGAVTVYAVPNRLPAGERLVDPKGVVGAEDEDVEYADDFEPGEHRA